ncbi:MAG: (d)CMP kinase [Actinomycetota bacterium]|nr:(d)CMP kinase [Actinomycetota bacterium]
MPTEPAETGLAGVVVAVDGPSGSGKSSTARGVAEQLGLRYLDTGAMYRAMTWQMLLDGIDVSNERAVSQRAESVELESATDPVNPGIWLGGVDVSREIRTAETTTSVSQVSAVSRVRELLVVRQREIIADGGIVVEGRDIGTVVAPDAALKIYLSADPAARASRRSAELTGEQARDVATVEADLVRRDSYDSTRTTAPLSAAEDAVVLDTTNMAVDEVIATVVALARERVATGDDG